MVQDSKFYAGLLAGKQVADKAISSLKGILQGINLDGELHEKEINELKAWSVEYHLLTTRNPFKEFMVVINNALYEDPTTETIEDLYWLCQKYESHNYYYDPVTSDLQTLMGVMHGIMSDGKVVDSEILKLDKWLKENRHLRNHYPYDEIKALVLDILADKKITEDERNEFTKFISQFINPHSRELKENIDQVLSGTPILGLCTSDPNVEFENRFFSVTGIFTRIPRKELRYRIQQLGGRNQSDVNKLTNYLIVADQGNPAWAFSCYGRKVEKAVNLRKEKQNIVLIHEYDFCDILDDM